MTGLEYVIALGIACLTSFALTPAMRAVAVSLGILARPVARSIHKTPIPYLGGVAIYAGVAATLLWRWGWHDPMVQAVVVVGGFVVALGLIDDIWNLPPAAKLGGQLAAALLAAVVFDVRIEWMTNPFGGLFSLGAWSIPLTVLWLVTLMNVMNLIDGLDGLAAGIAAIAAVTLLFTAIRTGMSVLPALTAAALAGASIGFLPFNFNPSRILMGDAGSMFLGFVLAVVAIEGALKGPTAIALAVPVLALGLPFADIFLAIIRRLRNGRSIAEADRDHLHHRLLRLGLSQREAVVIMYIISGWLGISAMAVSQMNAVQGALVITFVLSTGYFGVRRLGVLGSRQRRDMEGPPA